jgi:hypothetical protein
MDSRTRTDPRTDHPQRLPHLPCCDTFEYADDQMIEMMHCFLRDLEQRDLEVCAGLVGFCESSRVNVNFG